MKKLLISIPILILVLLLSSCSSDQEKNAEGTNIDIYYMNTKTSGLVSESHPLISKDIDDQINELLYMLRLSPDNLVYKSVLPNDIKADYTLESDGGLSLNFDSAYHELTGVEEILCRAAIVKTLNQLPQIEYIQINVNGSTLIDSNGEVVGPLTAENFVDDTQANTNYKVKLYFANEKGNALIEYDTVIDYTGNDTIEEMVINQLMNGPTDTSMYDTIPKGTTLLDLYKTDGTCYVDFNDKFLKKLPNVTEDVAIYSVVNTLVELPDINKVQFRINGEVVKTYMEGSALDVPFERNLDLIEKTD